MFPSKGSEGTSWKRMEQRCANDHWRLLWWSTDIAQTWVDLVKWSNFIIQFPSVLNSADEEAERFEQNEFSEHIAILRIRAGSRQRRMSRAWRSVEEILFWVHAYFEGNNLDVSNGMRFFAGDGWHVLMLVYVGFSCWATNYLFIQCIEPSSIGPKRVVHQHTCIGSVLARLRLVRRSFLSRKKCREPVMLMTSHTYSKRWFPKCPGSLQWNGKRSNGCVNASLCSRSQAIQTMMSLRHSRGNQLN